VRHIQWLECYPDTAVGKAGASSVIRVYRVINDLWTLLQEVIS
jgi:hypothetical protein